MVAQSELNTDLFDITPINANLVNSIDQVYALRQIALQFFCGQKEQLLIVEDEVSRARSIVALVDVLWRSNIKVKVLILSELSKTLEQIERSFQLHTNYLKLNSLSNVEAIEKDIHLCRYQTLLKKFTHEGTEKYLDQFDFIIVEDIEHTKNELFRRRMKYHKAWLMNINVPIEQNIYL